MRKQINAMASPDVSPQPPDRPDRQGRRRPFSTLMKKLAHLKGNGEGGRHDHSKLTAKSKKRQTNNYPYMQPRPPAPHSHHSLSTVPTCAERSSRATSLVNVECESSLADGQACRAAGARSMALTVSTDHETAHSTTAASQRGSSLAGTARTPNGMRSADSTFSSPSPSLRSLTTTLTTIQSLAPNGALGNAHHHALSPNQVTANLHAQSIHFNQPFPAMAVSLPVAAIPPHLAPSGTLSSAPAPGHPTTYATATANNLLTDNASILTLASSSKRRRRRSFDTDASVRALAPSSLFGGSRESLSLSVLSQNAYNDPVVPGTPGPLLRGPTAHERASIYSTTGILASERNSIYTNANSKQPPTSPIAVAGDGSSMRSGYLGHAHADSVSGSLANGVAGAMPAPSPLASPMELAEDSVGEKVAGFQAVAAEGAAVTSKKN